MLLLHHDHHKEACRAEARRAKAGAPGRTRTDEYGFTKPALWLLRHKGFEIGALTWICTTNFRLRRAACRTNYTLRAVGIEPRWLDANRGIRDRTRTD